MRRILKNKIVRIFASILCGLLFGITWTYVKDFMTPSNISLALLKINSLFIFLGIPLLIIGLTKNNKTSLTFFWIILIAQLVRLILSHKSIFKKLTASELQFPPLYQVASDLFISCLFGVTFFFILFVKEIEIYKLLKKEIKS